MRSGGQSDSIAQQLNAVSVFTAASIYQKALLHPYLKMRKINANIWTILHNNEAAEESDLNINLNKCEDDIFVQGLNLVHAAARHVFYDADVGVCA